MQTLAVSEPYQQTVGSSGSEPSTPRKIADIVLKLLDEKKLPLRQLICPDAVELGGKVAEALAASDKQWQELSLSSA
ncbi:Bcboa17 [Penicillium canescens]|uniref:Bcboa17 n=1 Tax=Penicillium canescens TaxID=5083 RepID=A0AAD6N8E9_PENCN|nr:Bcboa17 [Penicillium canescens]KAJ5998067.1 Bcboa17 [Penicillium canescens]KAJ6043123.1 Bcboa17 [Penicillium canescens]KAJ6054599.1 Bcboa17 [Penicillium canescens]KAJ6073542.1 Bcboa17 [Penicillium canescens]KAJ6080679.1 Bcboa17 [Penicillium canescens]